MDLFQMFGSKSDNLHKKIDNLQVSLNTHKEEKDNGTYKLKAPIYDLNILVAHFLPTTSLLQVCFYIVSTDYPLNTTPFVTRMCNVQTPHTMDNQRTLTVYRCGQIINNMVAGVILTHKKLTTRSFRPIFQFSEGFFYTLTPFSQTQCHSDSDVFGEASQVDNYFLQSS